MNFILLCRHLGAEWLRAASAAGLLLDRALRPGPIPIAIRLAARNSPRDR